MPPESAAGLDDGLREYWTKVAQRVRRREAGSVLAGDDTPYLRHIRQRFVERFLSTLPVHGRRVLELGCGPGGNLLALERSGPALAAGCDISTDMVALARETLGPSSPNRLVVADGRALPFRSGAFDVVLTVTVLQHNEDDSMAAIVGELCRVSQEVALFEDVGRRGYRSPTYVVRAPEAYADAFDACGFVAAEVRPLGIGATYRMGSVIRGAFRSRGYAEGRPAPPLLRSIEQTTLPVARLLDKVVPQRAGLCALTFRRREGAQASASGR